MTFLQPIYLVLLVLPLAAVVVYLISLQRKEKYAVRFTNLELLDKVAPEKPGWRRHASAAALFLGLVAMTMAVARPAMAVSVPREAATVILTIDVSLSMEADDVAPTRIEAAREAAHRFLDLAPEELEVGIVSFAGTAIPILSPTVDRDVAHIAIDRLTLDEGTAIGEGIYTSVAMALAERDQRAIESGDANGEAAPVEPDATDEDDDPAETIVVLSDGETTMGRPDLDAADLAADNDIPVSTVSFGTADGVVYIQGETIPVPANDGALVEVAERTGGEFFEAATADQLQEILDAVGSEVAVEEEQREVTAAFSGVGLIFTLLAAAGSLAWFSRMP